MEMSINNVQNQIKRILIDELFIEIPIEKIKEDDSIGTDLGLDSVGFVELAAIIRERFNIPVKEGELTSGAFTTIKSLSTYIASHLSQ